MSAFLVHIATIGGLPPARELADRIAAHGRPADDEFAVGQTTATDTVAHATLAHRTTRSVKRFDPETGEFTTTAAEAVRELVFSLNPAAGRLEIVAGPASAPELIGAFLSGCLALPALLSPIELDVAAAVQRLQARLPRFQLRASKVADYAANSYMTGGYAPKFLDTAHGLEFAGQYADFLTSATIQYKAAHGRATLTLTPGARFTFTVADEEDVLEVRKLAREIVAGENNGRRGAETAETGTGAA